MNVFLLAVIAVETTIIAVLGFVLSKKTKKYKKARENFTKYLDVLDRSNSVLRTNNAKLRERLITKRKG